MFQMLGLFAEFERAMIRNRVRSGMARAKASGTKSGKAIGRPAISAEMKERIRAGLREGAGSQRDIAAQLQVSRGSIASAQNCGLDPRTRMVLLRLRDELSPCLPKG